MNSTNRNTVKLVGAAVGGGALVTMGALTMSLHQQPSDTHSVAAGHMTLAATSTASGKANTVEATSMAVPSIKGPAPLPKEEAAAQ
ncbi:hypothetical protein [Mycobacterium sp. 1274761.0]|uniref:hypothetical protein n=1 Tax=Mycobacterium sp. 1274761.0 TaxID=1834077 RepID=UPI0008003856|nr:hypothetical protein [Mycobacterium sp. 1274761.0]OBK76037.1 hypothetical protein A5651_06945 [Mycobacterium sp. 1274761.0]